jgi:Fic family protein
MMKALNDWESYVRSGAQCPVLIQCALQHVQFESIHPFLDGNGRMGRLLITLFLMQRGRLSGPLLYLSAYLESNRREYYNMLQAVRRQGAWHDWLLFFLEGIEETALAATQRARQLLALRETMMARVMLTAPKAAPLVDALLSNPYMTVKRAEQLLLTSAPTARKHLTTLVQAGVLVEIAGQQWGRMYGAPAVLDILNNVLRDVLAENREAINEAAT